MSKPLGSSLCVLCDLCDSVVNICCGIHRRDTENTKVAQRKARTELQRKTEFLDMNSAFGYINYPPNALLII